MNFINLINLFDLLVDGSYTVSTDCTWSFGACGVPETLPAWLTLDSTTGQIQYDSDFDFSTFPSTTNLNFNYNCTTANCPNVCTVAAVVFEVTQCPSSGTFNNNANNTIIITI